MLEGYDINFCLFACFSTMDGNGKKMKDLCDEEENSQENR